MDSLIERLQAVGMSGPTAELVMACARLGTIVEALDQQIAQERQARENETMEQIAKIRAQQTAEADRAAQESLEREAEEAAGKQVESAPEVPSATARLHSRAADAKAG